MKKINFTFILFLLIPAFLTSQNTSDLLVKAVEKLPEEGMVITQSTKVINVELINSDQLDYSPVLYKDGILFTSNRKANRKNIWKRLFNKKSSNLFYAEKIKDGHYKSPVALEGKINGKINEGAITVNESADFMIFAVNDNKNEKEGLAELKLYSSSFQNGKWSKGVKLPINCETCTTCHPSLTQDSKTLYFVSNRPGGYGGMDIYKSEFIEGTWSSPINLGPNINTPENEVFPVINHDGTLYFSSNGKNESKDLDIYFTRMDKNEVWKKAMNIGEPFNSSADDFGFYIEKNGLSGLFSSNREGGKGMDDIYFWRIDQSLEQALDPSPVQFTIVDEQTGGFLANAEVTLIEFEDIEYKASEVEGPIAFVSNINQTMTELPGDPYFYFTDEYGNFYHDLKHGKDYMIIVEKDEYNTFGKMSTYNLLSGIKDIDIALAHPKIIEPDSEYKTLIDLAATEDYDENSPSTRTLPISVQVENESSENMIKENQRIVLDNIFYQFDDKELNLESTEVLDKTVQMMENFPEMEISLVAHTDARGNADYNQFLSQQRANAARDYFISKGIEAKRVKALGVGEEDLLNGCMDGITCPEEMHSINRRTEIVVTKLNPANEIFVKKE